VHFTVAGVAFIACLLGTGLVTDEFRRHPTTRREVPVLTLVWIAAAVGLGSLTVVGFKPRSLGGLFERVFIGAEILWIVVAMAFLTRPKRLETPDHAMSRTRAH
jgi:heme A synthase